MKYLGILWLLLNVGYADTVIKYGANAASEREKLGSTKVIFGAYQGTVVGPIISQYELGGWFDNTSLPGRKSSALLGASLGVHANAGYAFGQALVGPALITETDSNLGGHLQFNNDIAFGLRDPETKGTVGFAYKHVSSAGLTLPNKGRDFLMFRVSLPW